MQQPPKKTLLTPKRTLEISDSLEKMGYATMSAGKNMEKKSKNDLDKKVADYVKKSGYDDLKKSERYRGLALNSMKKK